MTKNIRVGSVAIPLDDYAISGTAILGIRDSGKTWAAKGLCEQLIDFGVQPIIFDPIGRWRFLKMAGDSKKPKGYKIVVAGGEQPDLPLTPQSAPEIVRAAMRENIPLVLDFFDKRLSKADWRRIVQVCFRTILYENKGVRHIFLEEAPEFVPQKVVDGETYAEVEKLVRMGGNQSIGITLIGQRAQEINKAVLDLCENLVLMRQRGSHAIEAVEKWMDKLSPDTATEVATSLPHLGSGHAWVFTSEQVEPRRVRTLPIRSFHPDRRKPQLTAKAAAARATNTEDFVSRLSGVLEKVIAEASANDPAKLRRRIQELEKGLSGRQAAPLDTKAIEAKAYERGRAAAVQECRSGFRELLKGLRVQVNDAVSRTVERIALISAESPIVSPEAQTVPPKMRNVSPERPRFPADRFYREPPPAESGSLPKGEAAILRACIMQPEPATRETLTVLTGYKKSSRDEYINRLRARGFLMTDPANVGFIATDAGRAAMPDAEPLPTGDKLQEFWLQKLPAGERKILEILLRAHPRSMHRDELNEAGFKKSSRNEYINRLRNRQLVSIDGVAVRASSILFG